LVFVLYLFSLRASDSRAAATAAASSMTMSARGVSAGDDVVVVSSETATATSLVSVPVVSRSSATADVGDTVVVNKETAVEVAQTTATEPVVPARDTDGDVYVIRHSAGGDDNVDSPPPPPPPSRAGILRFFSWLRGRKKEGAGRVAKLISKLQNEINDGATFAPAEMAQRLAEIERLERMEVEGEQKRKDAAAKRVLEETVLRKAKERHDEVTAKVASVEMLMTKSGPRHPEMLSKLQELEMLLSHPDLGHPSVAHANRDKRIEQVQGMRKKVEELTEADRRAAAKKVTELESELSQEESSLTEAEQIKQAEADVRKMKARAAARAAVRRKQRRAGRTVDEEEEEEDDEPEVVVIRKPKRKARVDAVPAKRKRAAAAESEEDESEETAD